MQAAFSELQILTFEIDKARLLINYGGGVICKTEKASVIRCTNHIKIKTVLLFIQALDKLLTGKFKNTPNRVQGSMYFTVANVLK